MTNQTYTARETGSRGIELLPAPPSEAGIAKLRRRIAATVADNGGAAIGLGDPFAEVFAKIATAETPAPVQRSEQSQPESQSSEPQSSSDDSQEQSETPSAVTAGKLHEDSLLAGQTDAELAPATEPAAANTDAAADDGEQRRPLDDLNEHDESSTVAALEVPPGGSQAEGGVVAAEVALGPSLDRSHADSPSGEPEEGEISTETSLEQRSVRAKADPQDRASGSDGSGEPSSNGKQDKAANSPVERRRYTDPSDPQGSPNEPTKVDNRAAADPSAASNSPRNDADASPRANLSTGNQGIDVSGMTATSSSPPLSVAANAALSAARNASASAATAGAAKSASAGSVAGTNSASQSGEAPSSFGLDLAGRSLGDPKSNGTKSSVGVDTSAAVERAKLAQRVSRGFQHLGAGGGQIRMRLSPDHLGSVQLQMTIQNGKLNGRMVTQSDAATQLLREQLPSLRATLESQGIRMERIDIETDSSPENASRGSDERQSGDTASGFAGQQFAGQQREAGEHHRSATAPLRGVRRQQTAAAATEPVNTTSLHGLPILPGSVDLRV